MGIGWILKHLAPCPKTKDIWSVSQLEPLEIQISNGCTGKYCYELSQVFIKFPVVTAGSMVQVRSSEDPVMGPSATKNAQPPLIQQRRV